MIGYVILHLYCSDIFDVPIIAHAIVCLRVEDHLNKSPSSEFTEWLLDLEMVVTHLYMIKVQRQSVE